MALTFAEFVAQIEQRHGLSPAKRKTTVGRLQQLQKAGLSKGTGRGHKTTYDAGDIDRMSEVLHLIDEGVSPAFALRRANGDTTKALDYLR